MPNDCAIDDDYVDFGSSTNDVLDEEDFQLHRVSAPSPVATPKITTPAGAAVSSKKQKQHISHSLERLNTFSENTKTAASKMVKIMQRMESTLTAGTGNKTLDSHDVVQRIQESRKLIRECNEELNEMRNKKRQLNKSDKHANKKQIKSLKDDINVNEMLLAATKAELKKQTKLLSSMNDEDEKEAARSKSDNSEKNSDSSSDSDSESIDEAK